MKCSAKKCMLPAKAMGLCMIHYQKHRRRMGLVRKCSVEGCLKEAWSKGWCKTHHRWWKSTGDPEIQPNAKPRPPHPKKKCLVADCPTFVSTLSRSGLCDIHNSRLRCGLDLFSPLTPGKRGMKPYVPGIPDSVRAGVSRANHAYARGDKPTPEDRALNTEYHQRLAAWRLTWRPRELQLARIGSVVVPGRETEIDTS